MIYRIKPFLKIIPHHQFSLKSFHSTNHQLQRIKSAVLQGLVLEPTLFIIYCYAIPAPQHCKLVPWLIITMMLKIETHVKSHKKLYKNIYSKSIGKSNLNTNYLSSNPIEQQRRLSEILRATPWWKTKLDNTY